MNRTELIAAAVARFSDAFSLDPTHVGVAPGRVELLGNHTDYNDGFVLTAAVDYATAIAGRSREDRLVRVGSASSGYPTATIDLDPLARASDETRWANYIRGVIAERIAVGCPVRGFDAWVTSSVPDGSGVSSSAALLVSVSALLEALFGGPALDPMDNAKLCRRAENGPFVGAPVGLLDQFSSACGQAGHALLLDCRSGQWKPVALPSERAHILIANSNVKHALAEGGGYSVRFRQCHEAARLLTGRDDAKLRDVDPAVFEARRGELDPEVAKRVQHILGENVRVVQGARRLEAGDLAGFGALMSASHASCRDLFENSCPEVDLLVEIACAQPGVYGAKLSGGGWGGSAVIVHEPSAGDALIGALRDGFRSRFGTEPTLLPTAAAPGAEARTV